MRCQKTKRDGNMCKASALIDKKYCALHSDDSRAAELGSRGGRRRTMFDPRKLMPFPPPKTAADVRDLLAQSIVELRAGQLDPRIAASICCLVTEFLKSLEVCTIEEVIEPLERERASESRFKDAINGNKENTAAQN
jgi:hypothetical protein